MIVDPYGVYYIGDSEGNVISSKGATFNGVMPGPISSITTAAPGVPDVFVTSAATNAFCNIGFENKMGDQYNIVADLDTEGVKSVVPRTTNGIVRIIDNRRKGGKLMCITTKGIHSMDD
ncbi:MAG: hypothetical protein IJL17_23170 [Kiritimatiellae bacterium]|nr:hypothetical protein [Kiritimatiellia bacterium]